MNITFNPSVCTLENNSQNNQNISFGITNYILRGFKPKFAPAVDLESTLALTGEKNLLLEQTELLKSGFWHFAKNQILPTDVKMLGNMKKFTSDDGDTLYYVAQGKHQFTNEPTVPEIYICTGGDIDKANEVFHSQPEIYFIRETWNKFVEAVNNAIPKS